ncbi:hypothetical protein [uncultured Tateyamaria sp.]|uniref:hypothetical protein n=1 Tax=uncultured Tateyamaria sp. TaxID=455651 RepID=UPI0026221220|nr:hypothetical protein [uncultured Tateyamaria sp.]
MSNVTQLRLSEHVQVDHDRLDALYSEMDHAAAEDVVCRAMEELALRMAHCDRLYRAGDLDGLHKASRSLIAIADQIGMKVMAQVAADVATCAKSRNQIALAATLSRLMRTGEESLTAIWDLQDITI